jgi:hypothetical protein
MPLSYRLSCLMVVLSRLGVFLVRELEEVFRKIESTGAGAEEASHKFCTHCGLRMASYRAAPLCFILAVTHVTSLPLRT